MIPGIYNNIQIDASGKVISSGNQSYAFTQENGQVSYFNIGTGTLISITSAGDGTSNFVHINPITSLSLDSGFDNAGANDGSLAYIGLRTATFYISATVSYKPVTANNVFVFAIAKNGTATTSSKVISSVPILGEMNAVSIVDLIQLTTGDIVTLLVSNYTSTDDLTVFSLNLTVHG